MSTIGRGKMHLENEQLPQHIKRFVCVLLLFPTKHTGIVEKCKDL